MVSNCVLFSFCIIHSLSFSPSTQQSCEYPKITTVGFVLKRPFVDVSSLCRSFFWDSFLGFLWDFFNIFCVWNFFVKFTLRETCFNFFFPATCELVSRVELQSSLSRVFDCPLNWVFNPAQPHLLGGASGGATVGCNSGMQQEVQRARGVQQQIHQHTTTRTLRT